MSTADCHIRQAEHHFSTERLEIKSLRRQRQPPPPDGDEKNMRDPFDFAKV